MNRCVVGLQWGDEGKGKVVDILAEQSDIVVRFAGGANAGHTVVIGDKKFKLHLMPSGAVREDSRCVIGNGVVMDPEIFIQEIDGLIDQDISMDGRLFISENAHVVLSYHKQEDGLREASLGKNKIGTTNRGIGPCYGDKIGRSYAIRMADFRDLDQLREKLVKIIEYKNKVFSALYDAEPIEIDEVFAACKVYAQRLVKYVTNTTRLLHEAIDNGENLLFEGAQGALLDLDHGTFPFVTSSNASALGMAPGCGVPSKLVENFLGVIKAYTTRVGAGPFPTELDNEIGQAIRDRGNEYGTTTGRPRRCGWFDGVVVKYSAKIGGINELAMMHLDTLSGMKELKICKSYIVDGVETDFFPSDAATLEGVECVYVSVPGWDEDLTQMTKYEQLPANAKAYVDMVEKVTGVPVGVVGVGPGRSQAIFRN